MTTLIINDDNSICGRCGKSAMPDDKNHWRKPDGTDGCGARYANFATNDDRLDKYMILYRNDIPYIGVVRWTTESSISN